MHNTKKAVDKRLEKAKGHVAKQGLIGKKLLFGLWGSKWAERRDVKDLLHDKTAAEKYLKAMVADINEHSISKEGKDFWAALFKVVDGLDYGYKATLLNYLVLKRSIATVSAFVGEEKQFMNPTLKKGLKDYYSKLGDFLQEHQKMFNSLAALAKHNFNVMAAKSEFGKSDSFILNWLSLKKALNHEYKDEKKAEALLKKLHKEFRRHATAKDIEHDEVQLKMLLVDEAESAKEFLKMLTLQMTRIIRAMLRSEPILKRAVKDSELPTAMVKLEEQEEYLIEHLVLEQVESLNKAHNQLADYRKKMLP